MAIDQKKNNWQTNGWKSINDSVYRMFSPLNFLALYPWSHMPCVKTSMVFMLFFATRKKLICKLNIQPGLH